MTDCPSDDLLVLFAQGLVLEASEDIREHVGICSLCRTKVISSSHNKELRSQPHYSCDSELTSLVDDALRILADEPLQHLDSLHLTSHRCAECEAFLSWEPWENPPSNCTACGSSWARSFSDTLIQQVAVRNLEGKGFEIIDQVGRGGMGIVYRARQPRLNREVAIKVLPPGFVNDPKALALFRKEAEIGAGIHDGHVLPVFDVLECEGFPALVMPFVEGSSLKKVILDRQRVRQGKNLVRNPHCWASLSERQYVEQVLPLLDKLVSAVAALHQAGVLHCDIKPSNVLIDSGNNLWVSDFGLAQLGQISNNVNGTRVGTIGFMSPEQSACEEIDERSDLYSLGITLYYTLTLQLPHGCTESSNALATVRPSHIQRALPCDFDSVILKAIDPDRDRRYQSAIELQEDWRRARTGSAPKALNIGTIGRCIRLLSRYRMVTSLVAVVLLLSAVLLQVFSPEYRTVHVTTNPPGASVVMVPLGPKGQLQSKHAIRQAPGQITPWTVERVPPGTYLVVVALSEQQFHEVYRIVPSLGVSELLNHRVPHTSWREREDGTIDLPEIAIPTNEIAKGMVYFKGGNFVMGSDELEGVPVHIQRLAPFYLASTEVTVGEYTKVQGVSSVDHQPPDNAVNYVTFDQATAYAERIGMRLPTEAEYEFAATMGATQKFPWGDSADAIKEWQYGPVKSTRLDQTRTTSPVYGLYSNVAEWTSSWPFPYPSSTEVMLPAELRDRFRSARVVRGGPFSVITGRPEREQWAKKGARWREGISRDLRFSGLGFRCARSATPRFMSIKPTAQ